MPRCSAAPRRSSPSRWPPGRRAPNWATGKALPFSNAAANSERNTVTTAPAAGLAAQLYRITHNAQYLQFAEMAYSDLGAPGPLRAQRPVRRPRQPQGRGGPAAVELQPGRHDRRRHVALPGHARQRLPVLGAPETAKAALAYFTPERLGSESRSSRRSTSATCCTSTPSPTTRPARGSPRPTSTTPGNTCACAATCSSPARRPRPSCWCRLRSCRIALLSSAPRTYFWAGVRR